jgi:hypothetical protein
VTIQDPHRRSDGGDVIRSGGTCLAAIRGDDWVAGVAQGLNVVKVTAADGRVEHEVKLMEFTKCRRRHGRTSRLVALSLAKMTRYEQETVGLSHSCALPSEPVYNVSVQGL